MLNALFQTLEYQPQQPRLFEQALTHRSFSRDHNERLEFLGDAVLDLVIGELLYFQLPDKREGELSRFRAELVRGEHLAEMARAIGLGGFLRLGSGAAKSGGKDQESILAGALEALLGAVYLDGGFDAARGVIKQLFAQALQAIEETASCKDGKTALQEFLQARHQPLPEYTLLRTTGQHHRQTFHVQCAVAVGAEAVVASGQSKKTAEQNAAARMLQQLTQESEQ